jgi:hypothetical protein
VIWLIIFIPFYGLLNQPPFSSFWDDFRAAAECVFTGSGGFPADDCGRAGWVLGISCELDQFRPHTLRFSFALQP